MNRRLTAFGILASLTLAGYWNSFNAQFVFDDLATIHSNAGVRLGQFSWNLLSGRSILYLTFTLNSWWSGESVFGFHLVNFVLHLANGFMIFLLAEQIFRHLEAQRRREYSLLAAALFLVHPVQTESVTYISSRSEVLSTFFLLAGFLTFVFWPRKRGFACAGAVGVSYLLALGSKETTITLPVVILLYDFLFLRPTVRMRLAFYGSFMVGALAAAYYIATVTLRHSIGTLPGHLSSYSYFLTQLRVIVVYVRLLFFPAWLTLDYDFPASTTALDPRVILSALFLLAIAGLGWKWRRRRPVLAFSIAWLFVTLAPTSSFVSILDVIFEHRLYLPLVGVCLSFPLLLQALKLDEVSAEVLGVVILATFLTLTAYRNETWATPEAVWADVIAKSPQKMRGHLNLGQVYQRTRRYSEALKEYETAATLPQDIVAVAFHMKTAALSNKASILIDAKLFDDAHATLDRIEEHTAESRINQGVLYLRMRRYEAALEIFDEAVAKWPNSGMLHFNRGQALQMLLRQDEARVAYERAHTVDPLILDAPFIKSVYAKLPVINP